jgi:mycothiol synthase
VPIVPENPLATHARVREAGDMTALSTIRAATAEDSEAILELLTVCDIATLGEPDTTIAEVTADLANDSLFAAVIEDPRGGLLGYAWVDHMTGHQKVWGDVLVRPGADAAVGSVLLDWLRDRADDLAAGLPLHVFANSKQHLKRGLYESAGGKVIRRFYRMEVRLDDARSMPVPDLDGGAEIRSLTSSEDDLRAMHAVVDTAFVDHFAHEPQTYEQWAQHTLTGTCADLSLWWLATVDGQPAAGLYGAVMPAGGYVDTLGTLRAYRGRGLGRALLLTSFAEFRRRGLAKVSLAVDATSPTGAVALYESVGMAVAHEGVRYQLMATSATNR